MLASEHDKDKQQLATEKVVSTGVGVVRMVQVVQVVRVVRMISLDDMNSEKYGFCGLNHQVIEKS